VAPAAPASSDGYQAQPGGYGWYGPPAVPEPQAPVNLPEGSWAGLPVAGEPFVAAGTATALLAAPGDRKARRGKGSRRTLLAIALAAVVLVAGAGVAGAAWFFGWFGGKSPADVLPGTAMAYVRVDLNPSMAQKTAMLQFFRDLPEVEDATSGSGTGETDPRKILWDQARRLDYTGRLDGIRYSSDIEPWLGDKAGLAVVPRGGAESPIVVGAIQVTDAQQAVDGLSALLADSPMALDVTVQDGYAIITNSDDTDIVLDDIEAGTLAQQASFTDTMRALGDTGIASGWADLDAYGDWIQAVYNSLSPLPLPSDYYTSQGQQAAALRFTADTAELAGVSRGANPEFSVTAFKTRGLGDLPADTGVALNLQGGTDLLPAVWDLTEQYFRANGGSLDDALATSGVGKDDIAALVGRSVTVAMPSPEKLVPGQSEIPDIGVVIVGDDPDLAQENVERWLEYQVSNGYLELHDSVDGDTYVVATTRSLQQDLAEPGERLSGVDKFTKAVPEAGQAGMAAYLDLESLTPLAREYTGDYQKFVSGLRSVGATTRSTGPGEASFTVRLVRS
jgi:hypothetical protein